MPTDLRLERVTEHNVRVACKLKLRADQEDLVAPVAWSLADAYTLPDVAWPRLIYDDGRAVGFVMAAFAPDHDNPLFHSYLWRLNVGAEHQGKGYGRFAVEEGGSMPGSRAAQPAPADGVLPRGPARPGRVLPAPGLPRHG